MEAHYHITEADFREATAVHLALSTQVRSMRRSALATFAVIAVAMIAYSLLQPGTPAAPNAPPPSTTDTVVNVLAVVLPWLFIFLALYVIYFITGRLRRRSLPPAPKPRRRWPQILLALALAATVATTLALRSLKTNYVLAPAPSPTLASQPPADVFHDFLLPVIPWLLIFTFASAFFMRARRNIKRSAWLGQPALHRPHSLVASDTDLLISEPTASHRLSWPHFTRCVETANVFLLYTGQFAFHLVPKSAFTPDTTPAFRSTLQSHVPDYTTLPQPKAAFPVLPVRPS